jgi:1-acyl-sn-glycerol-3-phosphate acyltransferase
MFDILVLLAYLPVDFKFVVKKELMAVPLWGYAMKKVN